MQSYHYILANELNSITSIEGKSVLVIGCSYGLECQILLSLGAKRIVGVDIIENLGKDYAHPKIEYHRIKAEDMPFDDNMFDVSCSFATFEHVQDPYKALLNMIKVTAKHGVIYCQAAPLWNSPFGHHKKDIFPDDPWIHLRKGSPGEMMSYYENICDNIIQGHKIRDHIDYIFSDEFNRISVFDLKKMINSVLDITSPINIRFGMNFNDYYHLLTPTLKSELINYTDEELLTDSITLILRKL